MSFFHAWNNQCGNPLSMISGRKTRTRPLISVPTTPTHTPLPIWKHMQQVNTKYIWCCFDREPCKNRTSEAAREDWLWPPVIWHKLCILQKGVLVKRQINDQKIKPPRGQIPFKLWYSMFRSYQLQMQNADQLRPCAPWPCWTVATCSSINVQPYR